MRRSWGTPTAIPRGSLRRAYLCGGFLAGHQRAISARRASMLERPDLEPTPTGRYRAIVTRTRSSTGALAWT